MPGLLHCRVPIQKLEERKMAQDVESVIARVLCSSCKSSGCSRYQGRATVGAALYLSILAARSRTPTR